MPKATVKTTYTKAKPKKKVGRPKGSKVTKRPPAEVSDLQQFLTEHDGEKRWVDLIKEFQDDCDHRLWPLELVATEGARKWHRCTGCRILLETL
jgi:hypothetical protein